MKINIPAGGENERKTVSFVFLKYFGVLCQTAQTADQPSTQMLDWDFIGWLLETRKAKNVLSQL